MPSRAIAHFPQQFLDLYSIKELPDTHKWGPLYDHDRNHDDFLIPSNTCDPQTVPFIDLNDDENAAANLIGQACKTWGVFQIINHNISEDLLAKIEWAGTHLFSLPLNEKLRAARAPDGVSGYGVARISSFFPKRMWSEGFTIMDSPVEHARRLWPNDYYEFCETIDSYKKAMKVLADRLTWLMLKSLGISKADIKWADPENGVGSGPSGVLQLNSYPACPDPERAMGMAAHTDSTILTILHQSNISGLQVLREESGHWITVPPRRGALVINVGDLMHMMTNGVYRSVVHRALVNRNTRRLSVAYLYGPPASAKIAPVAKLVGEGRSPMYRAITWSEYLGLKSKYFDKALASVRLSSEELKGGSDGDDDRNNGVRVG